MKKIYPKKHILMVFYGVSGTGKSTLVQMLQQVFSHVTLHRKDSTRPPRKGEPIDGTPELRLVKKFDPKKEYLLFYKQFGHTYGLKKDQLTQAFANHEIHLLIIPNIQAIKKFKTLYPHAITVYVHSDPKTIPTRLRQRDSLEYKQRKDRIEQQYNEFLKNSTFFDFIVLNFWDKKNSLKQAKEILKKYLERTNKLIST